LLMKLRQQISRLILTMYLRDPNKRYKWFGADDTMLDFGLHYPT
jgi:hypothetical protein